MEILLGVVLFVLGLDLGMRYRPHRKPEPINEDARRKQEEFDKHFEGLFNYDVNQAYRGRR